GAVLVLAAREACRRRPSGAAALPRLALATAGAVWLLGVSAGATGPLALSGVAVCGLPWAVVALCGEPSRGATRWRWAAAAGGLVLAAVALQPLPEDRPPSRWLEELTQHHGQGRRLVAWLAAGPLSGPEHAEVAQVLIDPAAPFLRRPWLARAHALAALAQQPADDDVVAVLVRAEADCLRFDQAEDLAETMLDDDGQLSVRGRMLADWVRDKARRARLDGLR
ncbi:MAG TPA: hypothetical protein VFD43_00550, partial [Planctomycetota bacterium]|nr:hypothetical protein [Planctomycetota bacterium]